MTGTRPYVTLKDLTVLVLHPIVASGSLVVDEVALLDLHARVNHIDRLEILLMQIVVQSQRIRESVGVEGEDAVAIHIVDIHPDDIRRNLVLSKQIGHLHHTTVRIVGVAALVVAQ